MVLFGSQSSVIKMFNVQVHSKTHFNNILTDIDHDKTTTISNFKK